ncbi:MAG: ion transporter [Chitinophagales bacterium]|nr:ion transporter [Chitinophagales bacterium]
MDNKKIKDKLFTIIFEADTKAGKLFDAVLLILILLSISLVMLESVQTLQIKYKQWFTVLEWIITALFTIEYILRIYCSKNKKNYIFSFYGIVDLLSILPSYLSLFLGGTHYLMTIRALRLLRVFRVFKMGTFVQESNKLWEAIVLSKIKILVFLMSVTIISIIVGSLMYIIESNTNSGFSSIPKSIYWAIVTMTTVGYGDITPKTNVGQFLSACLMILGYAIIAVPTGIVVAEFARTDKNKANISTQVCSHCHKEGHDANATYCKFCGGLL